MIPSAITNKGQATTRLTPINSTPTVPIKRREMIIITMRMLETNTATFVRNSKSLPYRLRTNSEQIADIDESKRPVAPVGCDPFESLRGLAVRHAASNALNATHSVLE